ncbi:hypothetical protein [Bacillus benzoevorans]|uniref:Uncharacterized protein n=1 Tax=Bacillus benzoevorans TaxID=1456 RepID=A0A7X0LU03_9BACI|nr:hypothetical protein [Bacillus benzoevorans]
MLAQNLQHIKVKGGKLAKGGILTILMHQQSLLKNNKENGGMNNGTIGCTV